MTSSKKDALQSAIAACGGQSEKLRSFAAEIVASLSELPSSGDSDPLDIFVAELVLSAAKERGVRFGPRPAPLPDDFDECHQAWRDGRLSLREAAESCGMGKTSFRRAVLRKEETSASIPQ